jgi:predicted  nucleic acid-binding Zn-ribbon protein
LKDKITAKEEEIINTQEAGNDVSDLKAELQKLEEQLKYAELEVAEMEIKLKELEERRKDFYNSGERIHWNINVYESPETLNFWFDFLDTSGSLS